MDLNLTEAASFAIIDRQITGVAESVTPAQYEIIRQVVYNTADLEYASLIQFSDKALASGAAALTATASIVVDVPEIQVSIVPKLQRTFGNPVYCCATSCQEDNPRSTKAADGLKILGTQYPNSIFIIGQDQEAMTIMIELLQNKVIEPPLIITTPPTFIESDAKQKLQESHIPHICTKSNKGGASVAASIIKGLVQLAWHAKHATNVS